MFEDFGINAGFVEDLHARYRQSPQSVDDQWRAFFDGFEANGSDQAAPAPPARGVEKVARSANGNGAAHGNGNGTSSLAAALAPAALPRVNSTTAYGSFVPSLPFASNPSKKARH